MRRTTLQAGVLAGALLFTATACGGGDEPAATAGDGDDRMVTVYTGRHYGIEPVFDEFTAATGIEVRFTTGSDPELRERLIAEGDNTPADVIITADAANIQLSAAAGVLQPVDSDALRSAIPAELRSEDDLWFSLSRRIRTVMSSSERVDDPPTTYAALGDPQWDGRLCLRPSTHPYTQSLVASLLLDLGEDATLEIVESWVANDPIYINSDTDILRAIAAGDCDVALTNSYYLGRLIAEEDPAFPVRITWVEQDGRGAHVNVSAAAVTAAAPNPDEAIELLEWLATDGQSAFSNANSEFPADPDVEPNEILQGWGPFTADVAAVRSLGELNAAAVELLSDAGYE